MFELSIEDLQQIIGELEIVRRAQHRKIQELLKQVDEMSAEIVKLRTENGRLGQADNQQ